VVEINVVLRTMETENKVLRWGGIAGILAFIVWIIEMPVYAYVDPFIAGGLQRFPEVREVLAISTILCMVTAFLSIAFVIILYRVLRRTNQDLTLLGTVLSIIGFVGARAFRCIHFLRFCSALQSIP
jgi:hypothetical protein